MKLTVSWDKPIRLKEVKGGNSIYSVALEKVPNVAGIYIFARRYGKSYEALYVGKSTKLRARVKGHLNNLKLMKYLENAKAGQRVVFIGQLTYKKKKVDAALKTLERAFIRNFLVEGHNIANQQGVIIRRHEITSERKYGRSLIPAIMYLEKGKVE
jgi:hypothetical protein